MSPQLPSRRGRLAYVDLAALGPNLKRWRLAKGLKLSAAAAELGVATSTWDHWENGRRFPTGRRLLELVAYTGLPLNLLVCANADRCPYAKQQPQPSRRKMI